LEVFEITKQREAILQIIRLSDEHYTADELWAEVKKIIPTISRATVYNTLHYLEQKREILRITGEDGKDRYDKSYIPHGHLICSKCFAIKDIHLPRLDAMIKREVGEYSSYELKVRYICPLCKNE
jgi:Fur family peroxide stress response transcriptional regulator